MNTKPAGQAFKFLAAPQALRWPLAAIALSTAPHLAMLGGLRYNPHAILELYELTCGGNMLKDLPKLQAGYRREREIKLVS